MLGQHWLSRHHEFVQLLYTKFALHAFDVLNLEEAVRVLSGVKVDIALLQFDMVEYLSPFIHLLFKNGCSIDHVVAVHEGPFRTSTKSVAARGLCGTVGLESCGTSTLGLLQTFVDQCPQHPTIPAFSERRNKVRAAMSAGHVNETDILILGMIANGSPNEEIAQTLHFSNQTIRNRVSNLLLHVQVANRTELANAWRTFVFQSVFIH